MAAAAWSQLHGRAPTPDELRAFRAATHLQIRMLGRSNVLRLTVEQPAPDAAARAAGALADALMAWDARRTTVALSQAIAGLQREVAAADAVLASGSDHGVALTAPEVRRWTELERLRSRQLDAALARHASAVPIGRLIALGPATASSRPLPRSVTLDVALTLLLTLALLSFALVLARMFDPRIGSPRELASVAGAPVLAELPARVDEAERAYREALTMLRSAVLRAAADTDALVVGITAPATRTPKRSVAPDLASSLARAGYRVLLVDADLRRPYLAGALHIARSEAVPLQTQLENPRLDASPTIISLGGHRTWDLVPSFAPAPFPQELLERGLAARLAVWRERYHFILLDGPPVLPFADMLTVAAHADGLLVCTDPARTTRDDVHRTRALLDASRARVLGWVLTQDPTAPQRNAGRRRRRAHPDGSLLLPREPS